MSKFDNFLKKNVIRAIWVIGFLLFIGFVSDCSRSRRSKRIEAKQIEFDNKLDSLIKTMPDSEKMLKLQLLQFKKVGLETSRDMIYNESAIDRKKLDTDKVLNEYNKQIKAIDKEIEIIVNE